jgi:hypothetical protein
MIPDKLTDGVLGLIDDAAFAGQNPVEAPMRPQLSTTVFFRFAELRGVDPRRADGTLFWRRVLAVSRFRPSIPRLVSLALGCSLFVYLLVRLGPSQILHLLLRIGWRFLLMLTLYSFFELARAAALRKCVGGEGLPYWDLIRVRVAGTAVEYLTFTGPFLAEPAKALLLRNRGLATPRAFAATISEYLMYSFSSAAMTIAGLIYLLKKFTLSPPVSFAAQFVLAVAVLFLAVSAVAIAGRIYLIGAILTRLKKLPVVGERLRVDPKALREAEDGLFAVLRARPRRFISVLLLEFLAQAFLVLEMVVILRSMGQLFSASTPLLIEAVTKFINLGFFFVPAQMGAAEGIYAAVFHALGLPASAGFSVALARRLRNLFVSGAGLVFLIVLRRRGLRAA